jgi:hypothetical protein
MKILFLIFHALSLDQLISRRGHWRDWFSFGTNIRRRLSNAVSLCSFGIRNVDSHIDGTVFPGCEGLCCWNCAQRSHFVGTVCRGCYAN